MWAHLCLTLLVAMLALPQALKPGDALPPLQGTTLEDRELTLPDASAGKAALLIITFSKAAGEQGRAWSERFSKDYAQNEKVTSYSIAFLEDVPSFFRGMVRGGIKRGTPAAMRGRFVTVTQHTADWKRYLNVADDKDAHLVLIDHRGRVQWTSHGSFDQKTYDAIKARIQLDLSSRALAGLGLQPGFTERKRRLLGMTARGFPCQTQLDRTLCI